MHHLRAAVCLSTIENNHTFSSWSCWTFFLQYGTGTNGSRHQLQYHAVHHPPPAVVHHQQQQHRKHQQTHDQQLQHKAIKNSTSNQYQIDMDYMKHRMEDRVTRLNDKCNEYRLNEPSKYDGLHCYGANVLALPESSRAKLQAQSVGVSHQPGVPSGVVQRVQGGVHLVDVQLQPAGRLHAGVPQKNQRRASAACPAEVSKALGGCGE